MIKIDTLSGKNAFSKDVICRVAGSIPAVLIGSGLNIQNLNPTDPGFFPGSDPVFSQGFDF